MQRVLIFGNSGSGKSTLAKSLSVSHGLTHFDLDAIAWLDTDPPQRAPIPDCASQINQFMAAHDHWVIEGCYADLLAIASDNATEMIFLNLSVEDCIANARSRPWEPHKYPSKAAQDANLDMLIGWISSYSTREDSCSLQAHQAFFDGFYGAKTIRTTNPSS